MVAVPPETGCRATSSAPTPPTYTTTILLSKTSVTITFADGEIKRRWLGTMVDPLAVNAAGRILDGELPTPLTLPSGDGNDGGTAVFIIGNIPGEVTSDATVTSADDVPAVMGAVDPTLAVPIDNVFDVDKSGLVLSTDVVLTIANVDPTYTLPPLP